MADLSRPLRAARSVLCRSFDDEAVLLELEAGVYFGLDPLGTRIWDLVAEGRTGEAVIDTLACEYDVERERLRQDVEQFLSELEEKKLIEVG